jgi:membrane protease YdiL (CAAX protease family)
MQRDARAYGATLTIAAILLTVFAVIYSIEQHIPTRIVVPFTAAALIEIALYLVPGFASTRALIESINPVAARALAIQLSTLPPYLVYALGTGTFHWRTFALLAGLTTIVAAWYAIQTKKHLYIDLLFLTLFATVSLLKVFPRIYVELAPHVTASILGQLMWIRLGILSVLTVRGLGGTGFGFLPTRKDWSIGIQHFILFAPVALVCGMLLKFAQPHNAFTVWWKGIALFVATFAGILWVVALWEEFFCRGMLQQILTRRFKSTVGGILVASLVFGLSHLTFRQFPNWKFALLATLAGIFYGWAYVRAGSVRAAMVTHAIVVATWRTFFA